MALVVPFLALKPISIPTTIHHRSKSNANGSISLHPRSTHFSFPSLTSQLPTKHHQLPFAVSPSTFTVSETTDFSAVTDDLDGEDNLAGSPWEGAVVYRRDASVAHLEYSTTLERLGLAKLSTGLSKSRASVMGIRLPARKGKGFTHASGGGGVSGGDDDDEGTPVLVSIDVTRRKRRLKLDGIVRTVITLGCNRCAEPAAECVFSNFTLLLSEDPLEEPEEFNMGIIYGEDKLNSFTGGSNKEEEEDEKQIDLDDRLHFPSEEKEIDISKHIRDIVHVEITINAICDQRCKGLCLKCGTNLNKSSCNCSKKKTEEKQYGPLKDLRKQMQQR